MRDLPGCLIVPAVPKGADGDANVYYATTVRVKAVREMGMGFVVVFRGLLDGADNKSLISLPEHTLKCFDMHMHYLMQSMQESCCHYWPPSPDEFLCFY